MHNSMLILLKWKLYLFWSLHRCRPSCHLILTFHFDILPLSSSYLKISPPTPPFFKSKWTQTQAPKVSSSHSFKAQIQILRTLKVYPSEVKFSSEKKNVTSAATKKGQTRMINGSLTFFSDDGWSKFTTVRPFRHLIRWFISNMIIVPAAYH